MRALRLLNPDHFLVRASIEKARTLILPVLLREEDAKSVSSCHEVFPQHSLSGLCIADVRT
jgi:hypothetical protein